MEKKIKKKAVKKAPEKKANKAPSNIVFPRIVHNGNEKKTMTREEFEAQNTFKI